MRIITELYTEPLDIRNKFDRWGAEMSDNESAFLCELIRENSPKKILEVGVAAGGTSAIILNCLDILKMDTLLFSVDVLEDFYRDTTKKTGYLVETSKVANKDKQKLYIGYLSDYMEEIGEVDFCIIDTMHFAPGEVLDFLVVFPYLAPNATVVLHDTAAHYSWRCYAYATQLLMDCVVADKISFYDEDEPYSYPNIGAFKINDDTKKYIDNVFDALNINWNYFPEEVQMRAYLEFMGKYYTKEQVEVVERAYKLNEEMYHRENKQIWEDTIGLLSFIGMIREKKIWLYGAGEIGQKLRKIVVSQEMLFQGYIVSESQEIKQEQTYYLKDINIDVDSVIVVAVGDSYKKDIVAALDNNGINNYIGIPKNVYHYINVRLGL